MMRGFIMVPVVVIVLASQAFAQSAEQETVLRDPETGAVLMKITVGITAGSSDKPGVALNPSGQDFVARFVAAVKNQDRAALEGMEHPESRRCHSSETEGYFNFLYTQNLAVTFANDNELRIDEIGTDDELPFAGSYVYAPRPSHTLNLTYGRESDSSGGTWSRTARYEIVDGGGAWAFVAPCPTEAGLAQLRANGIIE